METNNSTQAFHHRLIHTHSTQKLKPVVANTFFFCVCAPTLYRTSPVHNTPFVTVPSMETAASSSTHSALHHRLSPNTQSTSKPTPAVINIYIFSFLIDNTHDVITVSPRLRYYSPLDTDRHQYAAHHYTSPHSRQTLHQQPFT